MVLSTIAFFRFYPAPCREIVCIECFQSPGGVRIEAFRAPPMRGIPLDRLSCGNLVAVVARFLFDPSENRGYSGMKPIQNTGMKEECVGETG